MLWNIAGVPRGPMGSHQYQSGPGVTVRDPQLWNRAASVAPTEEARQKMTKLRVGSEVELEKLIQTRVPARGIREVDWT